jgi:hypothetical protein
MAATATRYAFPLDNDLASTDGLVLVEQSIFLVRIAPRESA